MELFNEAKDYLFDFSKKFGCLEKPFDLDVARLEPLLEVVVLVLDLA